MHALAAREGHGHVTSQLSLLGGQLLDLQTLVASLEARFAGLQVATANAINLAVSNVAAKVTESADELWDCTEGPGEDPSDSGADDSSSTVSSVPTEEEEDLSGPQHRKQPSAEVVGTRKRTRRDRAAQDIPSDQLPAAGPPTACGPAGGGLSGRGRGTPAAVEHSLADTRPAAVRGSTGARSRRSACVTADHTSSSEWMTREVRSARPAELFSAGLWCARNARASGVGSAPPSYLRGVRGAAEGDASQLCFAILFLEHPLLIVWFSFYQFSAHSSVASYVRCLDTVSDRARHMHSSQFCQCVVGDAAGSAAPMLALSLCRW